MHIPRSELLKRLTEVAEQVAVVSGVNLDEARRTRQGFPVGEAPHNLVDRDVYTLIKAGQKDRAASRATTDPQDSQTSRRLGPLVRLIPHVESLGGLDQRAVAYQTRTLAAAAIFDAASQPVSEAQKSAMTSLVDVVPWWQRRSARRAVARTAVIAA